MYGLIILRHTLNIHEVSFTAEPMAIAYLIGINEAISFCSSLYSNSVSTNSQSPSDMYTAILQFPGVCNNITGLRYIWLSDYFTTK